MIKAHEGKGVNLVLKPNEYVRAFIELSQEYKRFLSGELQIEKVVELLEDQGQHMETWELTLENNSKNNKLVRQANKM